MPKTFDFQSLHIFLKFSCFLGRSLGLELGTYFLAAHSFLFLFPNGLNSTVPGALTALDIPRTLS